MTSTPGLALEHHELTPAVVDGAVGALKAPKSWLIPGFSEVLKGVQAGTIKLDPVLEEVAGTHGNREGSGAVESATASVADSSCAGASTRARLKDGRQSLMGPASTTFKQSRSFAAARVRESGSAHTYRRAASAASARRSTNVAMSSAEPGTREVAKRQTDADPLHFNQIGVLNTGQPHMQILTTEGALTPSFLSPDMRGRDKDVVHEAAGPSRDVAESEKARIAVSGSGETLVQHAGPTDTLPVSSVRSTIADTSEPAVALKVESKIVGKTRSSGTEFATRPTESMMDGPQPDVPGSVRAHGSQLRADSDEVKAPAVAGTEAIERGQPDGNSVVSSKSRLRQKAIESMYPGRPEGIGLPPAHEVVMPANGHPRLQLHGSGERLSQTAHGTVSAGKDTFAALDREQDHPAVRWVHASPQRAEAGFRDPSLGWVSVRAQADRSGVRASLVPASPEAAQVLNHHLGALNAQLEEERTNVHAVTISDPEETFRSEGFSGGMPDQKGNEAGARQQSAEEAEVDRQSATRTPAARRTSPKVAFSSPGASTFSTGSSGLHISVIA